jgi:hypothetical protein
LGSFCGAKVLLLFHAVLSCRLRYGTPKTAAGI